MVNFIGTDHIFTTELVQHETCSVGIQCDSSSTETSKGIYNSYNCGHEEVDLDTGDADVEVDHNTRDADLDTSYQLS